jgi:macrolide transport system ATP-binding/permease protein
MIRVENLRKTYQMGEIEVRALDGVSLSIEEGEYVAIMGASGSGKSTLMHILGLLDVPDAGVFEINGADVTGFSDSELASFRNRVMGFVFQQFNLLARTSALENVGLPLIYAHEGNRSSAGQKMLELVGLGDRMHHHPNELSGGQQQRVAIARALVNNPSIIFADEPTGNLDSKSAREIMDVIGRLHACGLTVVLVTHDSNVASHAQRIIEIKDGKIIADQANPDSPEAPVGERSPFVVKSRSFRGIQLFREVGVLVRQSIRSLMANKVRTALSALGIMIGVTAVISTVALTAGAQFAMNQELSRLGSNMLVVYPDADRKGGVHRGAGAASRLSIKDVQAIREQVYGVKYASAVHEGQAQLKYGNKNWQCTVTGMEPDFKNMWSANNSAAGRFFTQEECDSRKRVALLGHTPMRELFGDENPIGRDIKINRQTFRIIGVLPEKGSSGWRDEDDVVYMPLQTAMRRLYGMQYVYRVDVQIETAEAIPQAQKDILALLAQRHRIGERDNPFKVMDMDEIQDMWSSVGRIFALLMSSIATISLLVGGVGIMNIMLVSVTERTREIGLRKALGARRRDILAQFLIEALVISFFGGGIGIAFGTGLSRMLAHFTEWTMIISANTILIAFGFSALIGVLFGLWPARKASLLNPIDALRYE